MRPPAMYTYIPKHPNGSKWIRIDVLVFDRKTPSSSTFEVVQRFGVDANSSGTVRRFESIVEPHPPLEVKLVCLGLALICM